MHDTQFIVLSMSGTATASDHRQLQPGHWSYTTLAMAYVVRWHCVSHPPHDHVLGEEVVHHVEHHLIPSMLKVCLHQACYAMVPCATACCRGSMGVPCHHVTLHHSVSDWCEWTLREMLHIGKLAGNDTSAASQLNDRSASVPPCHRWLEDARWLAPRWLWILHH